MSWDDYARHLEDPETLALCRRVHTVADEAAERQYPANMSAVARIRTPGKSYEKLVVVPRGEPENFPTDAELVAKFDGLVGPYLPQPARELLAGALLELDSIDRVDRVTALLRPRRRERDARPAA